MLDQGALLLPLSAILLGWLLAAGSPGPATLTISGTAMEQGRRAALVLALGVFFGAAFWGLAAALGFAALMRANVWIFDLVRYAGAAYLFYLAIKSLRSAWRGRAVKLADTSGGLLFIKGLLLHLTNPKAVLAWGSVYAIALAPGAAPLAVWELYATLLSASGVIFFGYALLFSIPVIGRGYARTRRGFELGFGLLFGAASLKILTLRLTA
ncbi:LysE family translocator [Arenibacterium sp. LLYu02]|uniref:LysE family translocator n=1 Tax=Arenibacterium sp. LLYu02 TaxID=3404132 RepID=UPI003B20F1E3